MRSLMRSVARYRMQKAGYTGINKKSRVDGKSLFAKYWRDFLPEVKGKVNAEG